MANMVNEKAVSHRMVADSTLKPVKMRAKLYANILPLLDELLSHFKKFAKIRPRPWINTTRETMYVDSCSVAPCLMQNS